MFMGFFISNPEDVNWLWGMMRGGSPYLGRNRSIFFISALRPLVDQQLPYHVVLRRMQDYAARLPHYLRYFYGRGKPHNVTIIVASGKNPNSNPIHNPGISA